MRLLSSMASVNPAIVTANAESFRYSGMVICGIVMGGMEFEMRKPAKMLPRARRIMGLTRRGLFSLMFVEVGKRGLPRSAKKMMRVL